MKNSTKKISFNDFSVVDLFCGVGGLTHGFVKEGFTVKAGIDFDKSCQYAYEQNNSAEFLHRDVTQFKSDELNSLFCNKMKILVGCAPCQPFSVYNHKKAKEKVKQECDSKWKLLYSFAELIKETKPEIVSMENVPLLLKFNKGEVFNNFLETLTDNGYFVTWDIVNAQYYGVPQRRKRLILLASRLGEIDFIERTIQDDKFITVKDAIGKLPAVTDGIHHPADYLHRARKLTDLNRKRLQATEEGGSWRSWDKSLWLKCHQKEGGKEFRSVYGRMKWNDVAPTITTYCTGLGNGRFGHPKQDRAITLREAALLQSFPENYDFVDPNIVFSSQKVARHIGNAVPVGLGIAIAKSIKKHIEHFGKE